MQPLHTTSTPSLPSATRVRFLPWAVTALVSGLAIYGWGSSYSWQLTRLTTYQLFPLLGLLAFSIMWSHYMAGAMRRTFLHGARLETYFRSTGYVVLVAIVLHPGLLIYQRFRDGYGLPPRSYETYVAPSLAWITLLGTVCLLTFLAFELHRWFRNKPWWHYVANASDAAMLGIFYHSLRLGSQLMSGWFKDVWILYGCSLVAALIFKYSYTFTHRNPA
jgi:hypothetical protein